jgi:hypothetical protein
MRAKYNRYYLSFHMLNQEYSQRLWDTPVALHSLLHIISEFKTKNYFSQMFHKLKLITFFTLLQFSQLIATRIAPMQLHQQNVPLPNVQLQNVQDTKKTRIQNVSRYKTWRLVVCQAAAKFYEQISLLSSAFKL